MSTITRELAKLFRKITNSEIDAEGNAHVVLSPADSLLINNARIALASMDAEPVGYFYADKPGDWYQISDGDRVPSHRRIPLYANPQSSSVVKLPNEFFSSEGIVVQIEKLMAVLAVHGIQYERRGNACRAAMLQAGNSPVIPEGWQVEAEKLAEMHGMSFVLFRHGEAPQCADPTKVVISFTDKGLGHDTLPAAHQEVK